jgi:hypothetical protein
MLLKLTDRQEKRIQQLEAREKEIQDRFFAFCEESYRLQHVPPAPSPTFIDPLGQLQSMEAVTEDEKKQKKQAIDEMMSIMGN